MHEEDQHIFNINVPNFYSKKIGTYPIVKRWLIPKKDWMGMSKNGNGPANSTYPFRCATRFAQRTMSTNNGTKRSEFQLLKKKIKYLQLYYGNKSADGGIKLPK